MRRNWLRAVLLLTLAALNPLNADGASRTANGQSMLVEQPAYGGMQFYIYKPANIPSGWYATYDGYPIFKGKNGVWYYGTREGAGITQTGYVVGSVIPSLAGLKPWSAASPVAPIYKEQPRPEASSLLPVSPSAQFPAWTRNAAFLAIEKWRGSVDRIGVLNKPFIPVAWKGERPQVIYVWAGNGWHQSMSNGAELNPFHELRRNLYRLTVLANRSAAAPWSYNDIALLARYATAWGYRWMGQVPVVDQFGNPAAPYLY